MKKRLLLILILIGLSLPSIVPLFNKGFFQSDDGEWMIIRFSAFHEALRAGEFPVRFLSRLNHGYGYPVANFLYPGFMYLAEIPKVLGFGFVDAIKIILGLSMVGSSVFVFLWLSKLFGKLEAFIGGIFYLYAPYHLYDIYKRGSVGEILALAILPFVLWQIERKSFFWVALGIGFLLIAHNTLALLGLPLIIIYLGLNILISKNRRILIYQYTGILVLSFGLSAFFWIPAILDLKYTVFSTIVVSNFSNYFADKDLIGLSIIFVFILTLILFLNKKIILSQHRLTVLLFVIGALSLFFSTGLSKFLWNILPSSFIQFPFRFLSIVILSASFLTAVAISVLSKNLKIILSIVLLLFIAISAKGFMVPAKYFDKGESFYSTNVDTTTVKNEYIPRWVGNISQSLAKARVENLNSQEKINTVGVKPNKTLFNVFLPIQRTVQINTVYFPGWMAFVNGEKVNIDYDNPQGLIRLELNKGQNNVSIIFKETPVRLFSDFVSILSFLLLLFLTIKKNRRLFN